MLMTGKEYLDSIRDGRRVYIGGEVVESGPKRNIDGISVALVLPGVQKIFQKKGAPPGAELVALRRN
jgi:hypothetical protein